MKKAISAVLVFLVITSAAAGAQRPTLADLRPGDTVKVWAVAPRLSGLEGAFQSFEGDVLSVGEIPLSPAGIVRARVSYPALRRVDVRRGTARSPLRIVAGGVLGYAGGLLAGGFAGAGIHCAVGCDDEFGPLAGIVYGAAVGAVAGTVTGVVIGARKRPKWEAVSLRR